MGSNEEYARNARDAEEWAQRSTSHEDRQNWLRIARGWLDLLRKSEDMSPSPQDQCSAKRREKCESSKSNRS